MALDYDEIRKNAYDEYERWCQKTKDDPHTQAQLQAIAGNEEEIIDAFYKPLQFGTSGLRGIIGAGTNRINAYTIKRVSQGLADYLKRFEDPSVVISFDSRHGSQFFARTTAAVLNGNGVKTYLFHELTPVSVLSYATRKMNCTMGVMITASHNPKIYNGFKVYHGDGYQVIDEEAKEILDEVLKLDYFDDIKYADDGNIKRVPGKIDDDFLRNITENWVPEDVTELNRLKTIYTPLNGTGFRFVPKAFNGIGYQNFAIVQSQQYPDPDFTTCSTPNPEKILAYDEGFKLLDRQGGDLIIATDPDADRAGAALYHDGMRSILTGNQLGILMLDYLCHFRPPRSDQFVMKSIVSSPLVNVMAEKYGFTVINTLTGFRYIGDLVSKLRKLGKEDRFYFAYEESDSFLISPFICDKDGISASVLIAEMAAFHKSQGKDLIDRLQELYKELGTCIDKQRSFIFSGAQGRLQMERIMDYFRNDVTGELGGRKIDKKVDYLNEEGFPRSNVMEFDFQDGSRMIIRPSGTEDKLKVYSFETGDFSSVERAVVRIIERLKEV